MWGKEKKMPCRLVATSSPGKPSDLQDLCLCSLARALSDHGVSPTWLLPRTFRNLIFTVSNGLRAKRFLKAFHYFFFFHLYKAYAFILLCFKTSSRKAESGSSKLSSLSYILLAFNMPNYHCSATNLCRGCLSNLQLTKMVLTAED